ncbi:hypothetical protein [Pedobacter suwonensis]|uniref:hypothetical protein n=1 Tax=Pedobacter suwonensis TaxID=332999 RepID=UPI003839E12C
MVKKYLETITLNFEDAWQIRCACKVEELDYIVTRNIKDFKDSEIPAFPPDELLTKI